MADTVEKIYCCDGNNNNDALLGGLLAGQNRGFNGAEYALLNGTNNQWNNPFIYLVWMMFAQRMWGNNGWGDGHGAQNIELQNQLASLRDQINNNQNSNLLMDAVKGNNIAIGQLAQNLNCDFNTLNSAICDVRGGIDRLSGQVGFSAERIINAANLGDCRIIEAIKDCCCQTQQNLLRFQGDVQLQLCQQTNTLQNGQEFINRSIERGFAAAGYQAAQDKCDIIRAGQDNTNRIISTLQQHWSDEDKLKIQDLKFENSQLKQNNYFARLINGSGCGCNTGCGCNSCGGF